MSSEFEVILERLPQVSFSKVTFEDGALRIDRGGMDGVYFLEASFPSVHFVGISDEGSRLRLLRDLGATRGAILRCRGGTTMDQFMEESLGVLQSLDLQHFIFMLGEEIIDVISGYEPEVRLLG